MSVFFGTFVLIDVEQLFALLEHFPSIFTLLSHFWSILEEKWRKNKILKFYCTKQGEYLKNSLLGVFPEPLSLTLVFQVIEKKNDLEYHYSNNEWWFHAKTMAILFSYKNKGYLWLFPNLIYIGLDNSRAIQ